MEFKIKNTLPFIVASKIMKYTNSPLPRGIHSKTPPVDA